MDKERAAAVLLGARNKLTGQFAFKAGRRPLYGFGINDANYVTQPNETKGSWRCPYYQKWRLMIERCYSSKYQERRPSYAGCSVCLDWKLFSGFRKWMESQRWSGCHLDKDLLGDGLTYSPECCVFVRPEVNSFLTDAAARRGLLPVGVSLHVDGRFRARVRVNGRLKHLGIFDSASDANTAWANEKARIAISLSLQESDPRVIDGLRRFANRLLEGLQNTEASCLP
jgi:hypothetical protein